MAYPAVFGSFVVVVGIVVVGLAAVQLVAVAEVSSQQAATLLDC